MILAHDDLEDRRKFRSRYRSISVGLLTDPISADEAFQIFIIIFKA